jgi:CheY-specific phosphatase CheX
MTDNLTAQQITAATKESRSSESVLRLTRIVSHQNADLEEVAKIVAEDEVLTARLLRAANPRALCVSEYAITTVEAALMRGGIGCAFLVAMTDPLFSAVKRAFRVLVGQELEDVAPGILSPLDFEHVVAEADFEGKASGCVKLRIAPACAAAVTCAFLQEPVQDLALVDDFIGELAEIVAGNFESNLCDAGLTCTLSPPRISHTDVYALHSEDFCLAERTAFRGESIKVFVDVLIDPWSR